MLNACVPKDERDLALIDGMNTFAAAIILSFNNLDEFLDKLPQQRMSEFGGLVGVERMVSTSFMI